MSKKVGTAVIWNFGSVLFNSGASSVFTLVLAHFIPPQAYGLLAMTMIFFDLAGALMSSGLGQAIIQRKSVDQRDLSTAFIANLSLSGTAYILLFFSAPYISVFYGQPELTSIIRVTGVVVLINALKVVQISILSRELNFGVQAKANAFGVAASGICAISVAYAGGGVWSLVAQILIAGVVSTVVLWTYSGWRPDLQFDFGSFTSLYRFGRNMLFDGILESAYQNSYTIVIGRYFGAEATGLYFFADKLNRLIVWQFTDAVQSAANPALAILQDDDTILRQKFAQLLGVLLFVIAPCALLTAAVAKPVLLFLFGSRWVGAAVYVQLFSIVGVLYPIHAVNVSILYIKGRSDLLLFVGVIKRITNLALLLYCIQYGIVGILIGRIIGSAIGLVPEVYYAKRLINYGISGQIIDAFKPTISAAISVLVVRALHTQLIGWQIFGTVSSLLAGLCVYFAISLVWRAYGPTTLIALARRRLAAFKL